MMSFVWGLVVRLTELAVFADMSHLTEAGGGRVTNAHPIFLVTMPTAFCKMAGDAITPHQDVRG